MSVPQPPVVVLPNWSSASFASLPMTPDSWFFPPHTIPDFGGAGWYQDGPSGQRVVPKGRFQLPVRCRNGLNSAIFLSAVSREPSDISSPDSCFNQNLLLFQPSSRSILCKSGPSSVTLCCLQEAQQDQHPVSLQVKAVLSNRQSMPSFSLLSPDERSLVPDANLIDIQKHRSNDQILLNSGKSACVASITSDEEESKLKIVSRIPAPAFPKCTSFAFLSSNPFPGLEHEVTAVVRSNQSGGGTDYMMIFDCKSHKWRTCGRADVSSPTRCMYTSNDHPRQVLVADDHSFKLCDHRVSENTASLLIFSSHKNAHLFPFEEIMSGTNFSSAHQHVLLSDMHVDLVDERFPGDSLLQLSHCVDHHRSGTGRLSRIRSQEVSFGERMRNQVLVAISNDHCISVMFLCPTRGLTVQPQLSGSPVHAFHLNDFPDTLSLSGCDSWQSRMLQQSDMYIEGIDVIPSAVGFSLVAVTRNGDLLLQDFEEQADECTNRNGTSFSMKSDAFLDLTTTEYLNYSIFDVSTRKRSQSVRKGSANSSKEGQPFTCKCCHEWHASNSIASAPPSALTACDGQQPSLVLDRLNSLTSLFDQAACMPADQTARHENLPKWNILSHNLLSAWSPSPQVCSRTSFFFSKAHFTFPF